MTRVQARLPLALLFTLTFSLACGGEPSVGGSGTDERGTEGESAETGGEGPEGEEGGQEQGGEGNSESGDGDGEPGDGDGDPGDGDGDPGDGDGDPGDGDGDSGDGDGEPGDGDGDGEPGDGDGEPGDGDGDVQLLPCGNKVYECGDTIDNDMDGLIDLADPECISPCDDSEATFKTDLPGQNNDCKQDCYFDDNSGHGDDKCVWDLKCDEKNPGAQIGCEYDPNFKMCNLEMPSACLDFCVPLVPNGCDCFGCCEIQGQYIYLDGAECSLDNLEACESCTFFENCNNECEPESCEVCFGQDPNDLPPGCEEPACPGDITPCFNESDCLTGQFCQTGCCADIVPQ